MAYTEIFRQRYTGNVVEGEIIKTDNGIPQNLGYARLAFDVEAILEHEINNGCSAFKGKVLAHITSFSSPVSLVFSIDPNNSGLSISYTSCYETYNFDYYDDQGLSISPGETIDDIELFSFTTTNNYGSYGYQHRFEDGKFPLSFASSVRAVLGIMGGYNNNSFQEFAFNKVVYSENLGEDVIPIVDHGTQVLTAEDFTDEEFNPTFSYSTFYAPGKTLGRSTDYVVFRNFSDTKTRGEYVYLNYKNYSSEEITLQVGLSLDGETMLVPYQDAPVGDNAFTFNLTEEILETLREQVVNASTVPIYYMTKTTRTLHYKSDGGDYAGDKYPPITHVFYNKTPRNFTIVSCYPQLNPTVKDILPETLALTGDENTFVRYESMAEYAINATPSKYATIVNQYVQCGSKKIENLPYGIIDDTESGDFIFHVLDSRGMAAQGTVFKNLVPYVKPTCYQKAEIEIIGETGANIVLTVNGNYYNGSFGLVDNTLLLEVRYTDGSGEWGEWTPFAVNPTFNGTTYKLEAKFSDFDYGKSYIFQSRITDRLNFVESAQYVVQMLPVFDWGENDFNFNVPVNINAETIGMNDETIIRHNTDANNIVLSAPNGNIYIRPKGTDETDGQTILYNNGDVEFGGDILFKDDVDFNTTVNFNGSINIGENPLSDYVIETGSEAMGTNGTWYWRKWASGKSECWGCRNFGRMAITTAWGNLYRSEIFTQDLPSDVFARTPDSININIVHGSAGGWICKHEEEAPSAITTGSFIYVRPASATITPSNIGFHIIGEWK